LACDTSKRIQRNPENPGVGGRRGNHRKYIEDESYDGIECRRLFVMGRWLCYAIEGTTPKKGTKAEIA